MSYKALLAEFIGTFALCFCGILAIYNLGAHATDGGGLLGIALAHGIAIAVSGTAFGAVSGGHFNPAVSFAMWVTGRLKPTLFIAYVAAQIAGGAFAGLIAMQAPGLQQAKCSPALGNGVSPVLGIILEAVGTFFLVAAVFGTAVDGRAPKMGALFIGLIISADILAIGPLTGGAMNPARFFGPNLAGGSFDNAIVYIVGPAIGALLAAGVATLFLPKPESAESSA